MRTFYIFRINREFKILTLNKPYTLFLALDNIHSMDKRDISLAIKLFDNVCIENNPKELNYRIFNSLRDSDAYTKFNNKHLINNYFTDESSSLIVNKTYIKLESTLNNPTFFKILQDIPNLFVVDFDSKDYFWLSI